MHAYNTIVPVLNPALGPAARRNNGPRCATIGRLALSIRRLSSTATHPTAAASTPRAHLANFRGILQAGGYAGSRRSMATVGS